MTTIRIQTPLITLGQFLKFAGIVENGAMARAFLATAPVLVNGVPEVRRGRKLYPGDHIQVGEKAFQIGELDE